MLGYVAFVYFNEGKTETLEEEYQEKELRNVEWFFPWNKQYNLKKKVTVGPGEVKATILKFGWENNCGHLSRINTGSFYR